MDIRFETWPAARRAWGLCWGILLALGLLLCLATSSQAQSTAPFGELPGWLSGSNEDANSLAWGDVDGDGDLDLAVGYWNNSSAQGKVFLNHDGRLETHADAPWVAPQRGTTRSVAWADMDGDGDLDLALGGDMSYFSNRSPSRFFRNDGLAANGKLSLVESQALDTGATYSIAWGDVDGDGDPDLAVGNKGQPSQVYLNMSGQLSATPAWTAPIQATDPTTATTRSVAWGDVDNDGDLDLAVGLYAATGNGNKVYRNDGVNNGQLQLTLLWQAGKPTFTTSIAWGDVNGDGKLDLVVGNDAVGRGDIDTILGEFAGNEEIYLNLGTTLQADQEPHWQSAEQRTDTTSISLGDIDGDGDLDLVATHWWASDPADRFPKVYLNQGNPVTIALTTTLATTGLPAIGDYTAIRQVALGDVDGDGDLDLGLALNTAPSRVYLNPGNSWQLTTFSSSAAQAQGFYRVAWGDVDGDGDLDLAVGNDMQPNQVYLTVNGQLAATAAWTAPVTDKTTSIAWGDMDGDGDLDLAVGNATDASGGTPNPAVRNKVYRNDNGQLSTNPAWIAPVAENTQSLAWGDVDGDGDLDLAVGNTTQASRVYRNEGGNLDTTAWTSSSLDEFGTYYYATWSLAWGDMDGDGDLDLALGNRYGRNQVYQNNKGQLASTPAWTASLEETTSSVAWGDADGDGDLDLAVGNEFGQPNRVYRNQGGLLETAASWTSLDFENTSGLAWGDVDGDGDLDLAAANGTKPTGIYLNQAGELQRLPHLLPNRAKDALSEGYNFSLAWGDVNGDGALDLAANNYRLFQNQRPAPLLYPNRAAPADQRNPEAVGLVLQPPDPQANFFATAKIHSEPVIPITYTLFHPGSVPVAAVRAFYSVNGGGHWHPAVATPDTITHNLATAPYPTRSGANTHRFNWDVGASGFLGQSDNVIFRLEAVPSARTVTNQVVGPFQQAGVSAQTFPLRVRGRQVRVIDTSSQATANAIVYRLPLGQTTGALPITDQAQILYRTDGQGYLQGRGQLVGGDQLVALAPITATASYTLYNMSAAPTASGLAAYAVTGNGVQTLTVSSANPLLLFNLKVALEWDARQDPAFLDQLEFDLRRTAEILFDASDGQATLGAITIYHNKEHWDDADVRIYASNALIPNADPGGIVRSEQSETINATTPYVVTYQPGHIRIGAVWNRFGEASGALGEDWPRTLAHELGHYAFYLYDNYLGLKGGTVVPVDTCTGTLMSDQYREDFSEFHSAEGWATNCAQTISAQRTGRADWQTITHFYPWLRAPSGQPQPGPLTLPLAVTQMQRALRASDPGPLAVALFDLVDGNGRAQTVSSQAQAVLYTQERLIDLGHPVVDKLAARGAHVGDRLCVYDRHAAALGCETITANDTFLTVVPRPDWQPELTVSPASSTTVSVAVHGVAAGLNLLGKLYPENSIATTALPLLPLADGTYAGTFTLASGALAGHIQVWVDEADSPGQPRRETTTSYALGGSPGKRKTSCSPRCISAAGVGATVSDQVAPAIAPDGQVLIYGNVRFDDGEFYALQKVNQLPTAPLWTTVVGDGYRILKSDGAPDLVDTSILFRYRGQDVPAGEEKFLTLYFWDEANNEWQRLPTVLNPAVNEASAQALGPGLYVLMSSLEIPIRQTGWNLIAYPVQETRPVTQALASLGNSYSTVYSYVATDATDPWKVYAPAAPAWVNDLKVLEFGQGYWINATQPMTWLVKGPDDNQVQAAASNSLPTPPATFYGDVMAGNGLSPAAGLPVQGLINGVVCGIGETQEVDGVIVYSLNVEGDGVHNPACLGAGQQVVITVVGLSQQVVPWQNDRVQQIILNARTLFLPVILR